MYGLRKSGNSPVSVKQSYAKNNQYFNPSNKIQVKKLHPQRTVRACCCKYPYKKIVEEIANYCRKKNDSVINLNEISDVITECMPDMDISSAFFKTTVMNYLRAYAHLIKIQRGVYQFNHRSKTISRFINLKKEKNPTKEYNINDEIEKITNFCSEKLALVIGKLRDREKIQEEERYKFNKDKIVMRLVKGISPILNLSEKETIKCINSVCPELFAS